MIASPVNEAYQQFADGQPWWHLVLARHLYAKSPRAAFQWLKSCVASLMPLQRSENEVELWNDLRAIEALADSPSLPSVHKIAEMSRAVWFRPNRDAAQTAVSKLYEMILYRDPAFKPRIGYGAPVGVLVDAAPDREAAFRIVIDEYPKRLAE